MALCDEKCVALFGHTVSVFSRSVCKSAVEL